MKLSSIYICLHLFLDVLPILPFTIKLQSSTKISSGNNVHTRHKSTVSDVSTLSHQKSQSKFNDESDRVVTLLNEALYNNSTSASIILSELNNIRQQQSNGQDQMDSVLNDIISVIDTNDESSSSSKLPWWTRFRSLARFSKRARLASLKRVLDISTPPQDDGDAAAAPDDPEFAKRRRRRSLVVLLRGISQMDNSNSGSGSSSSSMDNDNDANNNHRRHRPIILHLERMARRDAKWDASSEEMEKRLPPGLETPKYQVITRKKGAAGGYEVRRYESFSVCTVDMSKRRPVDASQTDAPLSNPQLSGASSFGALAGYLFGKNDVSMAMKMTTPVLTVRDGNNQEDEMASPSSSSSGKMSFVLPSDYWDEGGIERAPKPLESSGVMLSRDEGGYRAALMFGGYAGKKDVESKKKELLEGLAKDDEWGVVGDNAPLTLAQYNDPFTPPWKRRNEVSVPVVSKKGKE